MSRVENLERVSEARCADCVVCHSRRLSQWMKCSDRRYVRALPVRCGQRGQVQVQEPGLDVYSDRTALYLSIQEWPQRPEVRCAYG